VQFLPAFSFHHVLRPMNTKSQSDHSNQRFNWRNNFWKRM